MRWTPSEIEKDRVEIQWLFGASRVQKEGIKTRFLLKIPSPAPIVVL